MKNKLIKFLSLGLLGIMGFSSSANDISKDELKTMLQSSSKPIVIDVRTSDEYEKGHVPSAINIPLKQIEQQINQIDLAKETKIVLYCRSGYRAGKAQKILEKQGFTNLLHLEGDYLGWVE